MHEQTEADGGADDDYYSTSHSAAESMALTFDAIGRDHKFSYQCNAASNGATLRSLTDFVIDAAPCSSREPVVCDAE